MFLNDFILRKIAFQLQPWLIQEPEWDIKLGICHSHIVARNLRFDISALNHLIGGGLRLSFSTVEVAEVNIRIAQWSGPAFTVEVHGVDVRMTTEGQEEEGGSEPAGSSSHISLQFQKKILAKLDPEGSALHEKLETLMASAIPKNWVQISATNLGLSHLCLRIYDIRLRVKFSFSDEQVQLLLNISEVNVNCLDRGHGCLLKGFISSMFRPLREGYIKINARGLEILIERKDQVNNIISFMEPSISITMKDSRLVNSTFFASELRAFFTASELQMILAINSVVSTQTKHHRTGRQLWGIVRTNISSYLLSTKYSLYKVFYVAVLFLRLVKAYQLILVLVKYLADKSLGQIVMKMSRAGISVQSIQQQWKLISDIEKELPVQAISWARQVARHRVALKANLNEGGVDSCATSCVNYFWKILLLLAVAWSAICKIFKIIFIVFYPKKLTTIVSEDFVLQRSFSFNVGKISTVVSPVDVVQGSTHQRQNLRKSAYLDLLALCLLIEGIFLVYEEDIFEENLTFSLGSLQVAPSSSMKRQWKERVDNLGTVMWVEPAILFSNTDENGNGSASYPRSSLVLLENIVGDMRPAWKKLNWVFPGNNILTAGNPCLLVDMKNHWIRTDAKSSDAGSWKCSLVVGKLNLSFGHMVLLSLAVLFQQLQYVFIQLGSSGTARVFPHSPRTFQDSSGINWHGKFRTSSKGMKLAMLKLLPFKPFEFRALIAGLKIDILLRKEESLGSATDINLVAGQNAFDLTLDISKIDLVVWPTSAPGHPRSYDIELEEAMMPAPSASNSGTYVSQGQTSISYYFSIDGVNAYFEDPEEDQHLQILVLKAITFKISSVRDYCLSFGATSAALSVAFSGVMEGLFVFLNVDELSIMSQVIAGLFHAASPYVFGDSSSSNGIQYHPTMDQGILRNIPKHEEKMLHDWEAAALNLSDHSFLFTGTFEFDPSNLVLRYTRKVDERESSSTRIDDYSIRNPSLLATGVWLSLHKTVLDISCGEEKADIHLECSQFKAVLFRCRSQIGSTTQLEVDRMVPRSHDCLYEVCLSGCSFGLFVGSPEDSSSSEVSSALNSVTSTNSIDHMMHDCPSTSGNERLNPIISPAASSHCLVANFTFNVIFVGSSSVKNVLSAHQPNKLFFSLSLGGDFQRIHIMIQDGYVIVEAPVLANFAHCLTSYLHCLRNLLSVEFSHEKHMKIPESGDCMSIDDCHIVQPGQKVSGAGSLVTFEFLEAFTLKLSRVSLVILALDESGEIQEIISIIDLCLKLQMEDGKRKFLFDLSHMEIHSRIIDKNAEKKPQETQIAHFSSNASSISSSHFVSGKDTYAAALSHGRVLPVHDDARCSSSPVFAMESMTSGSESQIVQASHLNYILKGMTAFISAETTSEADENTLACSNQCWDGNGSVAGFDLTISLSEIQMVMDAAKFLNEAIEKEASGSMKDELSSTYQESPDDVEAAIPDGSVVTIQDVHQHMYIFVDRLENKYSVSGTVHYSLVGESALFRVKWLKQRRWNFRAACFSLMSLYAKSDSGQPLRLNYCSGSGFVDISSTGDSGGALWKIVSRKSESCEGDAKLQPYSYLPKNTFYLVNKKNECGVAFIDEVPEFVRKPGHPFKFKMVHVPSLTHSLELLDTHSVEADGSNSASLRKKILKKPIFLPCINLRIERVTMTIVHELPDHKDRFPLLQGCIYNTQINAQILSYKTRVMSKFTAELYYFSAHKIVWKRLVHPFETCIYYSSRFRSENIGRRDHGAPVRLHLRLKEVNISLTQHGLDILLLVIGKLDLAGPFAVKSSSIMANCWKVENLSSLNILCTFYDNQVARVGSKECSFFNLRHLMDQPLEAQYVLIKLDNWGTFSTSSIRLFLSESQTFAWRTLIKSSQDSSTYPGPCVVFDISNNLEGLSIVVSPLLRIHNRTELNMELRFQRPQQNTAESASVLLQEGDTIDDCIAAFDAINFSAGSKKALLSLNAGNFIFSLRPEIKRELSDSHSSYSVEWSDNLNGGKAIRLFGVIDKLSYRVRKAFSGESSKCSFSTASCLVKCGDTYVTKMHFLVQSIARDIPVVKPAADPESSNSPVELQEQKEVYLLPTLKVSNLLQSDISVLVTETDTSATEASDMFGNKATVRCGSTIELYANPAIMYFTVTLAAYKSSCKPVNSGDWVKKLSKQKDGIQFLDIVLEFQDGNYFASLRLTRSDEGILEAVIFTRYTLKNSSDFPMVCFTSNQKHLSRDKADKFGSTMSPDLGCVLPAKSSQSWFMKSNKLCIKLLDGEASHSILDLDALSGLAELSLVKDRGPGIKQIFKLGVSLRPLTSKMVVPSHAVSLVPRYVVSNKSDQQIFVRQCFLEDDSEGIISITGRQKVALLFQVGDGKTSQMSVFDKLLLKHRVADDSSIYVQFKPHETELGWSGPVCVASLGRFFLKFRRSFESPVYQSKPAKRADQTAMEFAAVHVVDEESSLVMQFFRPPDIDLPYRIENHLPDASICYHQKDVFEAEALGAGSSVNYVWDDLTRPHQLVVKVNGFHLLREVNLDKLRPWKPFYRVRQHRQVSYNLPLDITIDSQIKRNIGQSDGLDMGKVGYEVYAEGPTRVLRICRSQGSFGGNVNHHSHKSIQLRFSGFTIQLLGHCNQDSSKNEGPTDQPTYTPIIVGRFQNISLDSIFFDQQNYNQLRVQSINVDHKWVGAPFAAMLRRHQLSEDIEDVLFVVFVFNSTRSNVKRVKYSSILLQPIDLNLDEETMMKIVPFWRTSLSQSTQSQKYYFDHFEIHPVKIIANFLPVDSYISYSTAQETLRSLLHTVIKIPAIKNRVVELNGVSVTHVLVTPRELLFKCAQHYSWYAMRAIYIAKGSTLLPPSFASVFDDLASSSLDAFFDPSSSLLNVQGLSLGTFRLLSKYVGGKGFSGTKRYFGDLGKTLRAAGSNILFVAVTEVSDSVLRGAENSGFNGMVTGFHQGILKLAMEPSVLGTAFMEGGPDRKINLDQSPGVDEIYIEGYLQAMLDTVYMQEYLSVRVIDNQVILKNLPPNSSLINEIMDRVREFLVSKALLKGDSSTTSRPIRRLRGEKEWRIVPTVKTLAEHLFVSFAIRILRKQAGYAMGKLKLKERWKGNREEGEASSNTGDDCKEDKKELFAWKWGIGKFLFSAIVAYMDGRLCRSIPHPVVRRIVSGFLLSFLDKNDSD